MKPILLGFFFTVSISWAAQGNWSDSDSNIFGPKYADILNSIEALSQQNPDRTQLIDYGKTALGRTLRMLVLYRKDIASKNRPTLYVTGSIHGDEYLNIEDRLPETLITKSKGQGTFHNFIDAGGAIVFVPIVNPDGYDLRQRGNSHDVDLNRDWDVPPANFKGFKEEETRLLSAELAGLSESLGLKYRVTVDYHCCAGALLLPWSYQTENTMNPQDIERHRQIGTLAQAELGKDVEVGTTGEILGYYPLGTTKDYFYDRYGALSFTYEGRYGKENSFYDQHVQWWEAITEHVMKAVYTPPWFGPPSEPQAGLFRLAGG